MASLDEKLIEKYLENGDISDEDITQCIENRKVFPIYFGSALKDIGVEELLDGIVQYSGEKEYPNDFGFKIFKVAYDETGTRLCYGKVTGGELLAKQKINEEEKVDQIRLVSGNKYTLLQKATSGQIVAVKGLNGFKAGDGLGFEENNEEPLIKAYMTYKVEIPKGVDTNNMFKELKKLEQEDPQIMVNYDELLKEIQVSLMGEIQIEVIENIIKNRTGVQISFTNGKVLFKETISNEVNGVGHFEPLRHYGEVVLHLQPLPLNSGLVFESNVSQDDLSTNVQRQILTHLKEKIHKGVLIGAPITDMKISVIAGKTHLKHTEGGDMREATYRAVRQGLKKADSVILEPYYQYVITINKQYLSRVLYDLDNIKSKYSVEENGESIVIKGEAAVRKLQNYQIKLLANTAGQGQISTNLIGYKPAEDQQEIIEMFNYDSELDFANPTGSVFCKNGSGFYVPYNEVEDYMHIKLDSGEQTVSESSKFHNRYTVSEAELKAVVGSAGGRNAKENKKVVGKKRVDDNKEKVTIISKEKKPQLLIIDGYNMMFAWEKTKGVPYDNARDIVINEVCSYASYKGIEVILVFDAYKVKDNLGARFNNLKNLTIVYTKTGQTADSYIEKTVHELRKKYDILVASSDMAVQNVVFAQGARRISARELELEMKSFSEF